MTVTHDETLATYKSVYLLMIVASHLHKDETPPTCFVMLLLLQSHRLKEGEHDPRPCVGSPLAISPTTISAPAPVIISIFFPAPLRALNTNISPYVGLKPSS